MLGDVSVYAKEFVCCVYVSTFAVLVCRSRALMVAALHLHLLLLLLQDEAGVRVSMRSRTSVYPEASHLHYVCQR